MRNRIRPSTVNQKSLTGDNIQSILITQMKQRVNAIKFRSSTSSVKVREQSSTFNIKQPRTNITVQQQTDKTSTNFWPAKQILPRFNSINAKKQPRYENNQLNLTKFDIHSIRLRTASLQKKKFKASKLSLTNVPVTKTDERRRTVDETTYQNQLFYFRQLYDHLGSVLAGIQQGSQNLQKAISNYGKYIRNKHMSFIDDFTSNKQYKVRKQIRFCRIHEFLSISYLFLEIAQDRIENNESYLVNFIGFCLSNLIYLSRIYILMERRPEFIPQPFEKDVDNFEVTSYGTVLKNIDDVILRIQHNNQIITMIHKKLGRYNEKFENCIKMFLKNAERKKHSTCLCAHYIFQYLAMHIHESELVGISEFLQVAPTPYLAPAQHDYTLVIQPLGILKSGDNLRPFIHQFFKWASKYFDIVLWTWQMPSQIEQFTSLVEPYLFSKLYRYHCIINNEIFTKDLNRLGRKLQKTVIIDYDLRIFSETPKNGFVCRMKKNKKDRALLIISEIFQEMVSTQSSVEEMLTFYAEELEGIKGI